jgi:hypothetical protein
MLSTLIYLIYFSSSNPPPIAFVCGDERMTAAGGEPGQPTNNRMTIQMPLPILIPREPLRQNSFATVIKIVLQSNSVVAI